jgi:hypothetical protein
VRSSSEKVNCSSFTVIYGKMEEELSNLWGNLSLSEEERSGLVINNEAVNEVVNMGQLCLIGKLVAERMVSKNIVRAKMIRAWSLQEI